MKTVIRLLAIAALILPIIAVSLTAQDSKADGPYGETIEKFFALIKDGDYGGAIDYIYTGNPWFSVKSDDIQQLRSQFVGLSALVGDYISHELLVEEKIGGRLVYLNYFVAMERQPMSFRFMFYKPQDTWLIQSFEYSDDIDEWIEEIAKARLLDDDED
jgi:hypothetical protein